MHNPIFSINLEIHESSEIFAVWNNYLNKKSQYSIKMAIFSLILWKLTRFIDGNLCIIYNSFIIY